MIADFETVAQAEDRSFGADWVHELIEEMGAPVFDGERWTFPVSSEGEAR